MAVDSKFVTYQHPTFQALELLLPRTLWSETFLDLRAKFTLTGPPLSPASHSKPLELTATSFHHNKLEKDFPNVSNRALSVSAVESTSRGLHHGVTQEVDENHTDQEWNSHHCNPSWSLVALHRRFIRAKFPLGFHFGSKISVSNYKSDSWSSVAPTHSPPLLPVVSDTAVVRYAYGGPNQIKEQGCVETKHSCLNGEETQKSSLQQLKESEFRKEILSTVFVNVNGAEEDPTDRSKYKQRMVCSRLINTSDHNYCGAGEQQELRAKNYGLAARCKRVRNNLVETSLDTRQNQREDSECFSSVKVRKDMKNGKHYSPWTPGFMCDSTFRTLPHELRRSASCHMVEKDGDLQKDASEESRKSARSSPITGKKWEHSVEVQPAAAYASPRCPPCSAMPPVFHIDVDDDAAGECWNLSRHRCYSEEASQRKVDISKCEDGVAGYKIPRCRPDGSSTTSTHEALSEKIYVGASEVCVMQVGLICDGANPLLPHKPSHTHESLTIDATTPPLQDVTNVNSSDSVNTASISDQHRDALNALRTISQVLTEVRQIHLLCCPLCSSSAGSLRWCSWASQSKGTSGRSLIECSDSEKAEEGSLDAEGDIERDADVELSIAGLVAYRDRVERAVDRFLQHQRLRVRTLLDSRPNMYKEYTSPSILSASTALRSKVDHVLLRACHELGGVELLEALMIGLPKDL
ncbi:unnamed protein product [Phytomonas sp. EM1]|nr:unnamed protein product [Phytomonas sp. EM1]|eukprot:CCW65748.1 unnamed protein product [Phytomonas sp. isolate EM1]